MRQQRRVRYTWRRVYEGSPGFVATALYRSYIDVSSSGRYIGTIESSTLPPPTLHSCSLEIILGKSRGYGRFVRGHILLAGEATADSVIFTWRTHKTYFGSCEAARRFLASISWNWQYFSLFSCFPLCTFHLSKRLPWYVRGGRRWFKHPKKIAAP